jgi:hypothetical protein
MPTHLQCTKCKGLLPVSLFKEDPRYSTGYRRVCKVCTRSQDNELKAKKKNRPAYINENRLVVVEEGRQFKSPKDFIKFKRMKMRQQNDTEF